METYKDILEHHGILGMKWGVRRYRNKDGSLTPLGRKRYQNADGSLKDTAEKHIRENMWNKLDNDRNSARNKLGKKMNDELEKTEEAKAYRDLLKRRGIAIRDGKGNIVKYTLSYLKDDWSNPEKVLDEMERDTKIENAYHKKDVEITNRYLRDWGGALLKDLGYEDTEVGRDYLIQKGIIREYS